MYPDQFESLGIEFSTCKLHTALHAGNTSSAYSSLRSTYQIFFLVNKNLTEDQKYYHHFQYYDSDAERTLGGQTHIITIELAKTVYIADKDIAEMSAMDRWAIFLKDCSDQEKRERINRILSVDEGISVAAVTLWIMSKGNGRDLVE